MAFKFISDPLAPKEAKLTLREKALVEEAQALLWASGLAQSFLRRQVHRWKENLLTDEEFLASFSKTSVRDHSFLWHNNEWKPVKTVAVKDGLL